MAIEQNAKRGGLLPRRRRPAVVNAEPASNPDLGTVPAQHIDSVIAALTAPEPYTPETADRRSTAKPEDEKTPLGRMVAPELPAQLSSSALDEAGAEADDLRAQLAEIRLLLDGGTPSGPVPPAPPASPGRGRSRRRMVRAAVILLAACAVGAGVAAAVAATRAKDDARPAAGDSPQPTQSPAGLPATGAGVDAPGTALGVQLLTDRSIAVTEQALLPAGTAASVTFVLHQPAPEDLTGDAAQLRPVATDVRATLDGALVPVTQDGDRWTVNTTSNSTGERRVVLSYRLTGAVGASQPSQAGRALGLVLPLTTGVLSGQGVSVQIPADGVRNVVCAGASSDEALCATRTGSGWQADVPRDADSPAVLLQLDV